MGVKRTPATNRGVPDNLVVGRRERFETLSNRVLTEKRLDWYTASYHYETVPEDFGMWELEPIMDMESMTNRLYHKVYKLRCGGLFWMGDVRQGNKLDLSGDPLANIRMTQAPMNFRYEDIMLTENLAYRRRRVTRVDYAIDVFNAGRPDHCMNHYIAGKIKTVFRIEPEYHGIVGSKSGKTVYFGSRHNGKQFVRVYDKAHELGLLNEAITRVEMVVKKPHAENMIVDVAKHGLYVAGDSRLKTLLDFPKLRWWQAMSDDKKRGITRGKRKISSWHKWLDGQVKQSIRDHLRLGDRDFIVDWLAELNQAVADFDLDDKIAGEQKVDKT